jgi:alkylation response protein AidB-like acyl-CoA dehydrogenase
MTGLTTGFQLSGRQAEMLAELKRYLHKTFPREHECDTSPEWSPDEEYQWCRRYNQQLFDDGWLVPHWPEKYGGGGLTPVDQMLIREEMAYRRVGICNANGLDMLGPILLQLGTEEQKERHLRKIARMEEMWCQGYSEPDGGSDLTHLRTTAIRDGEEYVVNGSKIWTGHAMHADWMILLARTDPEQKGSKGLSMLLVDLHETEGIEIHPIRSMAGEVTFCQEYFMDARVPVANLVGPEHGGWLAASALLDHERSGVGHLAKTRRQLDDLLAVVAERGGVKESTAAKLGRIIEQVEAGRAMAYSVAQIMSEGDGFPPHMPSILKVWGTETNGQLVELASEVLGLDVADYHPEGLSWNFWSAYMHSFPGRIAGGSNEIQHDIVGTRYFGISG